jgi:pimeloyl-ACP methyl ester carboxylesterase
VPAHEVDVFTERFRDPALASVTTRLYRSYLRTLATTARGGAPEPRSTVPTLLISGARDRAVSPALTAGIERGGEDMRSEVVPGAGHFMCDTHPQLLAARVRTHLSV